MKRPKITENEAEDGACFLTKVPFKLTWATRVLIVDDVALIDVFAGGVDEGKAGLTVAFEASWAIAKVEKDVNNCKN